MHYYHLATNCLLYSEYEETVAAAVCDPRTSSAVLSPPPCCVPSAGVDGSAPVFGTLLSFLLDVAVAASFETFVAIAVVAVQQWIVDDQYRCAAAVFASIWTDTSGQSGSSVHYSYVSEGCGDPPVCDP